MKPELHKFRCLTGRAKSPAAHGKIGDPKNAWLPFALHFQQPPLVWRHGGERGIAAVGLASDAPLSAWPQSGAAEKHREQRQSPGGLIGWVPFERDSINHCSAWWVVFPNA